MAFSPLHIIDAVFDSYKQAQQEATPKTSGAIVSVFLVLKNQNTESNPEPYHSNKIASSFFFLHIF